VEVNEDAAMIGGDDKVERKDSTAPDRQSKVMSAQDIVESVVAAAVRGDFALDAVVISS
jgi:hypothetical protein